ncbi:uncharacterized protein LOC127094590 [Lathyrus oleraceus]|uniref:uncharacterized protein LOC127094590 n=1 Tax=Pisum sativum TaxID=3888 RepID=UPI0021D2A882|nr:uncharacterized protein LOC127094590 [Pisum sativum]
MPILTYAPANPALQYVHTGVPQAPNAQDGGQYPHWMHVAQTVPSGFSYPPQMLFAPNMPTHIAPETSRPASQVAPPAANPARTAYYMLLDDKMRAIEGFSDFGTNVRDLCFVSNVVLPQKLKVPDLLKYKGLSWPHSHITMYCRKMASYIDNDDLLIHCFQYSLSGASLDWYMGLERTKIWSWRDLSEAFLKQYKYNLDMAPTRLQLQNQAQRSNETFKEYAQCWREIASRVRPALSDNKLVDIFMGTLQGLYCEKMIGSSSANFADMLTIGERVENGLKSGKITDTTAPQTMNKRPYGGFAKKKEGEASVMMAGAHPQYQFPMTLMSYYLYPYVAATQYQQPPCQYQPQKGNQQSTPAQRSQNQQYNRDNKGQSRAQNNRSNFGNRPQIDKIPVPYVEQVPYLIHVGAIIPRELPAASPPFHRNHNPNTSRASHVGYIGHSTEDCWDLKKRIHELIDQEILTFSEEKPNVKTNPLPNHGGATVNVVVKEETNKSILRAEDVKTLMSVVLQRFEQFGFLSEEVEVIEPITIVYRKKKVEAPPKRIQPIHFCVPSLFPYQNTKAVPWNYETTTYLGGKEIRIPDTEIVNIAGAGDMTRSSRVFSPKYTPRVSLAPTVIPHKEKAIPTLTPQAGATVPTTPNMTTTPLPTKVIDNKAADSKVSKGKGPMVENEQVEDHKKSITFKESQEFLKLIKKSDFKIVDQLNQTPSKISILSLLLSSEVHRKALLKVLNAAHVM